MDGIDNFIHRQDHINYKLLSQEEAWTKDKWTDSSVPPPHPPPFFLGYEKKRREEHMPDQYNSTIASYLTDKCEHTALYKLSKDVHIKTSKIIII